MRKLRAIHFSPWADRLEDVDTFLRRLPSLDLTRRVTSPDLIPMARLDADWHGENSRAFAAMQHSEIHFLTARVTGPSGLIELAQAKRPIDEEWWLIFEGQTPQKLAGALKKLLPILAHLGINFGWYAFDEVSRTTTAFQELAPFLRIFIHDEGPIEAKSAALLPKSCFNLHRSWVANLIPFSSPFLEVPEEKIVFLGSKLGLTDHRKRQIEFLQKTYGARFVAIHDHSLPVGERNALNRFKVSFCPEGRKFTSPAMSETHTDRPFWSGCLGMVPVSENSKEGHRLDQLASSQLVQRYRHADLADLKVACDRALAASTEDRRRIYDHFNCQETVGTILANALHAQAPGLTASVSHAGREPNR